MIKDAARRRESCRKYHAKNREKISARKRASYISNPEKWKSRMAAWRLANLHRAREKSREWQKKNPEKIRASCQRRRALRNGLPYLWNENLWSKALAHFQNRCAYCRRDVDALHQDHFIPLASGICPGTVPWNMVPACSHCNISKGPRMPDEWPGAKQELPFIVKWLELQKP